MRKTDFHKRAKDICDKHSPFSLKEMTFNEFDKSVKTYYPLNKERSRYLILFYSGEWAFYTYDQINKSLIREL